MLLVAFEGIDGSGKTTLAEYAAKELRAPLLSHLTSTPVGRFAREAILSKSLHPLSEALLILSAFAELETLYDLHDLIIADRHLPSFLAYQAAVNGHDVRFLKKLIRALNLRLPDLVIYCDVPLQTAFKRLRKRGRVYDIEAPKVQSRVAAVYKRILSSFKVRKVPTDTFLTKSIALAVDAIRQEREARR